jgi:hypothetical protein
LQKGTENPHSPTAKEIPPHIAENLTELTENLQRGTKNPYSSSAKSNKRKLDDYALDEHFYKSFKWNEDTEKKSN